MTPATRHDDVLARRQHAGQGEIDARLSLCARWGIAIGVPPEFVEAAPWYRLATEAGNAESRADLDSADDEGRGASQTYAQAAKWYREAAEQGQARAQYRLGALYAAGHGVPKDLSEAARWYRLAAEQFHARAQFSLGQLYAAGASVEQDPVEAHKWANLAVAMSFGRGRTEFAEFRDQVGGTLTPARLAEAQQRAREWLDERGGPQRFLSREVREFWTRAERGDSQAQDVVGTIYAEGLGAPQDYAEAVKWYRLAAAQGHARAQYNLGVMSLQGLGVPQDPAGAVEWFRKAAERGTADAQFALGVLYSEGAGVPQDRGEAFKWLTVAAALSPSGQRQECRDLRESLAKAATPQQMAESQGLADEWIASFQKRSS